MPCHIALHRRKDLSPVILSHIDLQSDRLSAYGSHQFIIKKRVGISLFQCKDTLIIGIHIGNDEVHHFLFDTELIYNASLERTWYHNRPFRRRNRFCFRSILSAFLFQSDRTNKVPVSITDSIMIIRKRLLILMFLL